MKFFNQYVKGFWNSWFRNIFTAHNCLIHLMTSTHIVGFISQHFLERICGAVCFERPYFHFPKTLATQLSFTTKRLLRHERVWPNGTRVNFIINHVI